MIEPSNSRSKKFLVSGPAKKRLETTKGLYREKIPMFAGEIIETKPQLRLTRLEVGAKGAVQVAPWFVRPQNLSLKRSASVIGYRLSKPPSHTGETEDTVRRSGEGTEP